MDVRAAEEAEVDAVARVWYEGWHDAHAAIVPAELTRARTLESFRQRIQEALSDVRVAGPPGAPVGFYMVKGDELYQLFVSVGSRGSGVAAALIGDAEARLAASGVETAWLACAIGNGRAARFYEKHGWGRVGNMINRLDTLSGEYLLEVWRYEKPLTRTYQDFCVWPYFDREGDRRWPSRTSCSISYWPGVSARRISSGPRDSLLS